MQAPSPATTPSSSRLPTLRPGQQAAMPTPQSTTARPSRVIPSDAAVTAPNPRVRHPGSHHPHHTNNNNNSSSASTLRGGQSGLSTRSRDTHPSSHSTSIGVHSFFTVDGASHSINSLYGVVTPDGSGGDYSSSSANALSMTNNNNNNNRDSTRNGHSGSSRLRFPPQTLPLPHSHHESYSSTLQSPAFVVPAPPAKLDDAAGHTRTAHLEYTGMPRSLLPSHTYLPSVEGGGGSGDLYGGVAPVQQGGLQALQEATTGLLVRHLTHDHDHRSEGEEKEGGAAGSSERNAAAAAAADVAPSATASARADALKKAAPFVSAALRDAGVDDRVNPFLLDKMLRRGRRQVAAADAAAAAAAAKARATPKNALAVLGVTVPEEDGEGDAAAAHFSPAAARFHEPPALRAAYEAVPARTDTPSDDTPPKSWEKKAKTPPPPPLPSSPPPRNAFDDVLDEYARVDDEDNNNNNSEADTGAAAAAASGKGGASAHHGGQLMALAMSSADYTRLAAAASANDAALVRQLVNYYTAQLQTSATRRPGAATAAAGDGGRQFSLLEAVLAVSREYVEVRASEVGMPGRGTAALSTRRRHVVTQLLTLNQTRIPESLWVTSAPPLSRLNALTTAAATSTAGRKSPALRDGVSGSGSGSGGHNTHGNREGDDGGGDDDCKDGARRALTGSPAVLTAATLSRLEGTRPSAERRNSVDAASVTAAQREDSIHQSQRANITEAAAAAAAGSGTPGNTIFPAARPTDRSQVYMLAEVLDRMLHDPAHPQWVELLCNPEVARYVFSDSETRKGKDGTAGLDKQQTGGGEGIGGEDAAKGSADAAPGTAGIDYSQFESLVQDKLWGPPGEHRLTAYTSAAYQVLEVLDAGLSELVRQVTCHCTERGALLDLLRQSVVDLAAAQVHVLTQVKQRARADAVAAHNLREENAVLRQELETTQRKLAEVTAAHEQLLTNMAPIQLKSDRLDELTARVASKARRFEGRRHDDHLALLQLLEESMKQTASAAVDRFYNEVEDIQARHGADGDGDRDANVVGFPAEMPSVAAARSHAAEQKLTMERMYTESHQLLRALQDTVDATNAVCAPLYKKMILADVSPVAKVASSKWATIARAVGAFEREKRHRQRVYEVFTEYCTVYRHHRADDGLGEGTRGGVDHHDDNGNGQPAGVGRYLSVANSSTASAATAARSHGEFFLVDHSTSPQTAAADGAETTIEDEEQQQQGGDRGDGGFASERGQQDASSPAASTEAVVAGRFDAMQQELKSTAPAERQQSTRGSATGVGGGGNIITYADLEGMSATDCTVDEVNALFRPDFDVRGYLRGSWQAYVHDRKLQEAASSVDDAYTLRLPDLLQMLCDLQTTLAEVTLRMRAMADSGAMQALLRPPLEPPAHPEQPCALCSRRDTCELDRQRRREAMARIARDLQGKMDAVESKSRAAQLERDEARREVRRLQMELQQAAEGNLPASRRGGSGGVRGAGHGGGGGGGGARGGSEGGVGGGGRAGGPDSSQNKSSSLMRAQNSSASLYRRGRRETTAPRESSFSKANPRTRKNTSVMPTSPTSSTTRARRSPATFSLTAPEDEADAAGRGAEDGAATPHFAGSMVTMLSTSANMSAPSLVSRNGRVDSLQSDSETPQQAREQGGNGNTSNSNSSVGGRDTDSIKVQQQQQGRSGDEGEEEEEYDDKDPESGETSIPRGRRSTVFM